MNENSICIAVVDDEVAIRDMLGTYLKMKGYAVLSYSDGSEALDSADLFQANVVISDLNMPEVDGLTLFKNIKENSPETICILITGMATLESTITALRTGVDDYILKPFDLKDLERVITKNVSRLKLKLENERLNQDIIRERNALKQKNIELKIINDMILSLRSHYNVDKALEDLNDKFEELFNYDNSFYYSRDKHGVSTFGGGELQDRTISGINSAVNEFLKAENDSSVIKNHLDKCLDTGGENSLVADTMVAAFKSQNTTAGIWGFLNFQGALFDSAHKENFGYLTSQIQDLISQLDTIVENQNRMLSSIFNQIQSIIIRVDLESGGILTNKPGLELINKGIETTIEFNDVKSVLDGDWNNIMELVKSAGVYRGTFVVGSERDSLIFGVSVMEYADPPFINEGLLITAKDITDQKKIEDMKADLISNVSHELKTPIAIVKEYLSLLHDEIGGPLTEMQGKFLKTIISNLERLERIIMNFLDMSKLTTGRLKINIAEEDIISLIRDIAEPFYFRYENKGMTLNFKAGNGPLTFPVDRDMVAQVLVNLLENAYKYAGADCTVYLDAAVNDSGHLIISVADNGKGIAKKDQKKIFDRFYRAGLEDDVRLPGSGLGLAIIKDMLELIGGNVRLESEFGKGSTFFAEFPPADILN